MLLDTKLESVKSSRCWSFYDDHVVRSSKLRPGAKPDDTLAYKPSSLLSEMLSLVNTAGPSSEALSYYSTLSSAVHFHKVGLTLGREALSYDPLGSSLANDSENSSEETRSYLRLLRNYGLSLALTLVMEAILEIYFPDESGDPSQVSSQFVCELVSLAREARRFRPLGATFIAAFLNVAWAVGNQASRRELQIELSLNEVDFEVERAVVFSRKLNHSLDVLRSRTANEAIPLC